MSQTIAKLLKLQHKATAKAAAKREALAVAAIDNIDSANAIARVFHPNNNARWTAGDEKLLVATFAEAIKQTGKDFSLLNRNQRKDVLRQTASVVRRSTAATKIRLRHLDAYPAGARG